MDGEWIISGYCRVQDQARTVMAECDSGQWDFGCGFPDCDYAQDCPVGKQLNELADQTKYGNGVF